MSKTTSLGSGGPSYWSYMAFVMGECLEKIIQEERYSEGDIPKGVYNDSLRFFKLVLQATGKTIYENPPASINAYTLAAEVVKRTPELEFPKTREPEKCFRQYFSLLEILGETRNLTKEEIETAKSLKGFFYRLHQDGEYEAYGETLHADLPKIGNAVN